MEKFRTVKRVQDLQNKRIPNVFMTIPSYLVSDSNWRILYIDFFLQLFVHNLIRKTISKIYNKPIFCLKWEYFKIFIKFQAPGGPLHISFFKQDSVL